MVPAAAVEKTLSLEAQLARAVRRVFRHQLWSQQERFGTYNAVLAREMGPLVLRIMVDAARRAGAPPGVARELVDLAEARVRAVARAINDTSAEMYAVGRHPRETIFSTRRSEIIAQTEAAYARQLGRVIAAKARRRIVRWLTDANPCEICRRFARKRIPAGRPFGRDKQGRWVYHPPVHPSCRCQVELMT